MKRLIETINEVVTNAQVDLTLQRGKTYILKQDKKDGKVAKFNYHPSQPKT